MGGTRMWKVLGRGVVNSLPARANSSPHESRDPESHGRPDLSCTSGDRFPVSEEVSSITVVKQVPDAETFIIG